MSAANGFTPQIPPPPIFAGAAPTPSLLPPPSAPAMAGYSSANAAAKSAWAEHTAQDGRKYYYNTVTRQSTWEKPEELKTEAECIMARCPWREFRTNEGKVYYAHSETKEAVWVKPDELTAAERAAELATQQAVAAQLAALSPVATQLAALSPVADQPGSSASAPDASSQSRSSAIEEAMKKTLESFAIESPMGGSANSDSSAGDSDEESEQSDSRGGKRKGKKAKEVVSKVVNKEELFKELLRDRKVPSSASWETAVRMIQEDRRYTEIKHLKNRRQVFNNYKTQRQKEEKEEQRLKVKRAREDLEHFLLETSHMGSHMKYRAAEKMYAEMKVWTSVSERDRRDIFDEAIRTIEEREREQMKALQRRNIENFADILSGMSEINYLTTWVDTQQLLSSNEQFKFNKDLLDMDKEDALICFQKHITKLEKEEDDRNEEERKKLRRQQRKNREAFLVLLDELHDRGRLTANSLWKDCFRHISSDERFEQMLHQPGSTPLDLFKFYVEDLKKKFPEHKRIVKEIMKDRAFTLTPDTKLEEFLQVVNADERGRTLDPGNVERSFLSLHEKALSIEEEKRAAEKRALQRHADAFKELMANAEPPVGADTSWDAVKERFGQHELFLAIPLESERLIVFKEFLKSLADSASTKHGKKKKKKSKKASKSKKKSADSDTDESDADGDADSREPKKKRRRRESAGESDANSSGRKDKKKHKHRKKKKEKKKEKEKEKEKGKDKGKEKGKDRRASGSSGGRGSSKRPRGSNNGSGASPEFDLSEGELEEKRQRLIAQLHS